MKLRNTIAIVALGMLGWAAHAGPIRSVGQMAFVDVDTVVIADWRGGELHGLHLSPAATRAPKPFNLKDVSTPTDSR